MGAATESGETGAIVSVCPGNSHYLCDVGYDGTTDVRPVARNYCHCDLLVIPQSRIEHR